MKRVGRAVIWVTACSSLALSQTASEEVRQRPPDFEIYDSFFSQIAALTTGGDTFYPRAPAQPIVLTNYENQAVRTLAADYKSRVRALQTSIKSLRLERLFQTIESGQAVEKLKQQLEALQEQQPKLAMEYFQSLKLVFSASRFEMVQDFVLKWEPNTGSPFAEPAPASVVPTAVPHKKK